MEYTSKRGTTHEVKQVGNRFYYFEMSFSGSRWIPVKKDEVTFK